MRKYWIILIVFLSGCSVSGVSVNQQLESGVAFVNALPMVELHNQNSPLFSYYLPKSVGKRDSNQFSATLISHGQTMTLSLDAASIIMNRFYRVQLGGQLRKLYGTQNALAVKNGSFTDSLGVISDYRITILPYNDPWVMIYAQNNQFLVSSIVLKANIRPVLTDMLIVLRSAEAETNDIVNLFSNKVVVDYNRISRELLEFIAPESGTIVDMLKLISGDFDFDETIPDDYYDDDIYELPAEEPQEEGDEGVDGIE